MNNPGSTKKTPDWRSRAMFEAYNKKISEGRLDGGCRLCEAEPLAKFEY